MRSLLAAGSVAGSLALGFVLGPVASLLAWACVLASVGLCFAAKRPGWALVLSLCACGLARGASHGVSSEVRVQTRGVFASLVDVRATTFDDGSDPCTIRGRLGNESVRVRGRGPCEVDVGQRVLAVATKSDSRQMRVLAANRRGAGPLQRWIGARRRSIARAVRGDPAMGLVVASTLGVRRALPGEAVDAMRNSGLAHLIAISGIHLVVVALGLNAVATRLAAVSGISSRWAALATGFGVAAFVATTGAPTSALRAAAMVGAVGAARWLGRPLASFHALMLAVVGLLFVRPDWCVDAGFQLSACAVALLITAHPGTGPLASSYRVGWGVAPITQWHFGAAPLVGIPLNVVAIPVSAAWMVPLGILGLLAFPWLGPDALQPAAGGAALVLDLARAGASVPPLPAAALSGLLGALALAAIMAELPVKWRPPRAALAAWLVVLSLRAESPDADQPEFAVYGSPRSWVELLRGPPSCARNLVGNAGRLEALLEATASASPELVAGHEGAARRFALRSGARLVEECVGLQRRAVIEALRACGRVAGGRRVMLRGGPALQCRVGDRWVPLPDSIRPPKISWPNQEHP